jgi:hypothetical protein
VSAITVQRVTHSRPPLKIKSIVYDEGPGIQPLLQVNETVIQEFRQGAEAVGPLTYYCIAGASHIKFWPNPSVGDVIKLVYVAAPTDISVPATSAAATAVGLTAVPSHWHWDTLVPGAIVDVLEKEQRLDKVEYWQQRYQTGLARMATWMSDFGGGEPTPVYDGGRVPRPQYPDVRNR